MLAERKLERWRKTELKRKILCKILLFSLVFLFCFAGLNTIFQPVWFGWSNYDTTHGFYKEPPNTIETVFLGTSAVVTGISPMEIYENNGIASYNLGTEQQPILASYYWAKEAYRLHPGTLKTIVLDVSGLRRNASDAFYHKALDAMQLSSVKYEAVMEHIGDFWDALEYLVPLLTYHDRWKTLGEEDFKKESYEPDMSVKGYEYVNTRYLDADRGYQQMSLPEYVYNEEADPKEIDADHFYYFEKLAEFCSEHKIQLVLIKIPTSGWSSSEHKSMQLISEEYGLDFIDFNYEPFISEIHFQQAMDTSDSGHLNYYGAQKVSCWLGNYLQAECKGTDVREDLEFYAWNEQAAEYHRKIVPVIWENICDPCDYVENTMSATDYTMFIMAKDEASNELTDVQRQRFADMGMTALANLGYRDSYLAVIENGTIVKEEQKEDPLDTVTEEKEEAYDSAKELSVQDIIREEKEKQEPAEDPLISYKGFLSDGTDYDICSGGYRLGNTASCKIGGSEYAPNRTGLNFVVYDNRRHEVVDTACFDTHNSSVRDTSLENVLTYILENDTDYTALSDRLKKLYLYHCRCIDRQTSANAKKHFTEDGLLNYLNIYGNNSNQMIFLSVKDEASASLDDNVRSIFKDIGLRKLSKISYRDSYLAIVSNKQVLHESRGHGSQPIAFGEADYELVSGGWDSGNCSSVIINGRDYSPNSRGLNIVVYDTVLGEVVDTAVFDTNTVPVKTTVM